MRSSSQGEQLESLLGELGVGQCPRAADPRQNLWSVAFGEQVGDIPLFVPVTPMRERVLTEHVLDRSAQRLAAVDHEQDRLLGIEAAVDEVGQQRSGEGGVLTSSLRESPSGIFTPSVEI